MLKFPRILMAKNGAGSGSKDQEQTTLMSEPSEQSTSGAKAQQETEQQPSRQDTVSESPRGPVPETLPENRAPIPDPSKTSVRRPDADPEAMEDLKRRVSQEASEDAGSSESERQEPSPESPGTAESPQQEQPASVGEGQEEDPVWKAISDSMGEIGLAGEGQEQPPEGQSQRRFQDPVLQALVDNGNEEGIVRYMDWKRQQAQSSSQKQGQDQQQSSPEKQQQAKSESQEQVQGQQAQQPAQGQMNEQEQVAWQSFLQTALQENIADIGDPQSGLNTVQLAYHAFVGNPVMEKVTDQHTEEDAQAIRERNNARRMNSRLLRQDAKQAVLEHQIRESRAPKKEQTQSQETQHQEGQRAQAPQTVEDWIRTPEFERDFIDKLGEASEKVGVDLRDGDILTEVFKEFVNQSPEINRGAKKPIQALWRGIEGVYKKRPDLFKHGQGAAEQEKGKNELDTTPQGSEQGNESTVRTVPTTFGPSSNSSAPGQPEKPKPPRHRNKGPFDPAQVRRYAEENIEPRIRGEQPR